MNTEKTRSSYPVPGQQLCAEQIIRKSRFICTVAHTPDRDAANGFIQKIKKEHRGANHNCSAFITGRPNDPTSWGMNDDGEPKGSAGKPMFKVLQHSGIGEICGVVTRYFGGIKLGTGGLARAYSSSLLLVLRSLDLIEKIEYTEISLTLPYCLHKTVEILLAKESCKIAGTNYSEHIEILVLVPTQNADKTLSILQQLCHQGLIVFHHIQ